jgi:sugar-specific transcriptional regulator TrmB
VFKLSDDEKVFEDDDELPEEEDGFEQEDEPLTEPEVSEPEDVMSEFMDLSEKQLQVYSLILTLGQVTTGDIAIVMGTDSEEVQNVISELERNKLLTILPGLVPRYQAVPPFDKLVKEVSTIGERIEKLREELKEQLRTASMTIRDSLFDLAKENLEKIQALTGEQDAHKSQVIERIGSVLDAWSETSDKVVEESTSKIEKTVEKAKKDTSEKIAPVLSSAKNDFLSQVDALKTEAQSWASCAKSITASLKSKLTGHVNTFQEKAIQLLDNQSSAISDNISTQIENTCSNLEKSKIIQIEQLEILKENTAESFTTLSSQITQILSDAQNSIGKSAESVSSTLAEEMAQAQQTVTTTIQEHSTADETAISEFDTGFNEGLADYSEKHNQALEELATSIESVTSNLSTQSQSACSSISQQVDGLATRTQDQLTSAMNGMRELSVNSIQDVFRVTDNSSKSLLDETETQLSGGKERLQIAMDETSENMKTLSQRSLDMYSGVLDKTRVTIGQQLGGIAERTKSRIEEFANTTLEDLETLKISLHEQITQAVAKGSEQIRLVTTSASNEINQGVQTELHQLGTKLDEQMAEYRTMHDTMTSAIEEKNAEQVSQHSEMLDSLLTKTTTLHEEMLNEVDTIRRHSIGDLDTRLSDSTIMTTDSILHMKAETSEIIENMESLLRESISTTSNKVQNAVNGARSATDTYLASLREKQSTVITGIRARREHLRDALLEAVENSVTENKTRLHDQTTAALQTLTERSDEMKTSAQTEISSVGQKGTALFTIASEEVTQAFETVDSNIRTTLETAKNNLSNSLDELKDGLNTNSASFLGQLDSSLNELESTIDTELEQRQVGMDSASGEAGRGIESLSEKLTTTVEGAADSLRNESLRAVTASMASAAESVEKLKPELETSLTGGYASLGNDTTAVKSALERLLSKLEEGPMLGLTEDTLDEVFATPAEGAGADAAAVLSKVWERVGATDFPGAKDFWTISTRSAVLAHISDMVQRAKSKITLILAYPTEIPTEMLVELKTTTGVELVVTEGGLLADKARPLIGRGNIRVRTRTEMDVYACVRDSEEVLLAPVTKDDRDVIGIATEDPGFVKFVMGVVGPIFQAKTKLLRPGDI